MGSGPAYEVVTITALRDGAAWEELARRMLAVTSPPWPTELDSCRHEVEGKLLLPVYWSALQEVDLDDGAHRRRVPTTCRSTCRTPGGPMRLSTTTSSSGTTDYWQIMRQTPPDEKLLDIQACFQVAHGSGIRPEAILMQKVMSFPTLGRLLTSAEEHDPTTWPGTYMAKGLEVRDQWESKLLRTSAWSPLW